MKVTKNLRDEHGQTVLHYAAQRGHFNIIKYLMPELDKSALTSVTYYGSKPEEIASLSGKGLEIVEFLDKYNLNSDVRKRAFKDLFEIKDETVSRKIKKAIIKNNKPKSVYLGWNQYFGVYLVIDDLNLDKTREFFKFKKI